MIPEWLWGLGGVVLPVTAGMLTLLARNGRGCLLGHQWIRGDWRPSLWRSMFVVVGRPSNVSIDAEARIWELRLRCARCGREKYQHETRWQDR